MRKTVLYAASAAPLQEDRLFAAAYGAVNDARRAKCDRTRKAQDKRLSLGAALLLKAALSTLPDFTYGAEGKPYCDGAFFSLAHSGELVLCAVSDREIGCDAERIAPCDLKLAKRFFHPSEYAALLRQADRDTYFCRLWAVKESYLKLTGRGLRLPLDSFTADLENQIIQHADKQFCFTEYPDFAGYRCAVCTAEQREIPLVRFDLSQYLERGSV